MRTMKAATGRPQCGTETTAGLASYCLPRNVLPIFWGVVHVVVVVADDSGMVYSLGPGL